MSASATQGGHNKRWSIFKFQMH